MNELIGAIKTIENSLTEKMKELTTEDEKMDAKMALGCLKDASEWIRSVKLSARYASFILKSLWMKKEVEIIKDKFMK